MDCLDCENSGCRGKNVPMACFFCKNVEDPEGEFCEECVRELGECQFEEREC